MAAAESREIAALKSAIEEANASGLTSDEVSKAEEVLVQEERKLAVREARVGALEDLKAVGATSWKSSLAAQSCFEAQRTGETTTSGTTAGERTTLVAGTDGTMPASSESFENA